MLSVLLELFGNIFSLIILLHRLISHFKFNCNVWLHLFAIFPRELVSQKFQLIDTHVSQIKWSSSLVRPVPSTSEVISISAATTSLPRCSGGGVIIIVVVILPIVWDNCSCVAASRLVS